MYLMYFTVCIHNTLGGNYDALYSYGELEVCFFSVCMVCDFVLLSGQIVQSCDNYQQLSYTNHT